MEESRQKTTKFTEGRIKHWRRLIKLESATKARVLAQGTWNAYFDPMFACKQPTIGSGATAIGSAARAPDEESGRKFDMQRSKTSSAHSQIFGC
jgi:hypothetical protein